MALHGRNILGNELSIEGTRTFQGFDPARGVALEPAYHEATDAEIHRALELATEASAGFRGKTAVERAAFLERIAEEIMNLGDELIGRANEETGLPEARLQGERGRTVGQLRLFAEVVREGSWIEARIDTAIPDREPLPKPDLRRMLVPLGSVVIFGASNFPLAFSVAGGDTASALAAGNPVVAKAHPAHPGTSELVGTAIQKAVEATDMPTGLFSLLHGTSHEMGLALVKHPLTRAVGFTGSLKGGRALFDAGASRHDPIPVYAEMGSINPVFLLPGALADRAASIAAGMSQSVTLGVGQFCTNPGLLVGIDGPDLDTFSTTLAEKIATSSPGTMLHPDILEAFEQGIETFTNVDGVDLVARSGSTPQSERTEAPACFFSTSASRFLGNRRLSQEVFGPATLLVRGESPEKLVAIAAGLQGHLTATVFATEADLVEYRNLISILETKVGRLIYNGFPTGVEVCPSMHHGGPYPATTNQFTSVGTAAIQRFARPLCYQSFPATALPEELHDDNPGNIWRMVNGEWTKGMVEGS